MRSRTENSVKNIIFGLGVQGIEVVLKFVGRTIFIRYLAVEYLGVNGLFSEILTMFSLAELGIGSAIGYALYKPLQANNHDKIAALMNLYKKSYCIIGIVVGLVGIGLIPFLDFIIRDAGSLQDEIIRIYLFYLFNTASTYFFSYKSTLLTADQKNYIVLTIKEICNVVRTIIQCLVLVRTHNFYFYLAIETVLIFINNMWVSKYTDYKYPYLRSSKERIEKQEIFDIMKNVKALFLTKISTILVNSTDNMLITAVVGLRETGLYSNYTIFISLINTVLAQVFNNMYPSVGNLNAEGDTKKSHFIFKTLHMMNFWLYSTAAIGFYLIINDIITLWLGEKFILPQNICFVIAVNIYIKGMLNAVWIFKDTYGLFKFGQYMTLLSAILNIILSVILGMKWGLGGILIATAISRILTNSWYDPAMLFKHGFVCSVSRYYLNYLGYTVLCVCVGGVLTVICNFWLANTIIMLILKIVIVGIFPSIIYIFIFYKSDEFQYLLRKVIKRDD